MKVAVCVATYRRPVMLDALLESLAALSLESPAPEVVLVVVENDVEGSADPVLRARRVTCPWPILTATEPVRNISLARNRAIAMGLAAGADWIAFVDDDERVSARWLAELLRVQAATGAEVVGGRVANAYGAGTPGWVIRGDLPERLRLPTGAPSPVAETCNALVGRGVFALVPGSFDERFGLSGGSDSHFFLRARRAGARIVWADDAIVHEMVPASRTTMSWLLRRAFRVGNSAVCVARAELPLLRWLPRRFASAGYRIMRGLVMLLPALVRGRAAVTRALRDVCLGAGALAAMTGYRYVEYRQTHGA